MSMRPALAVAVVWVVAVMPVLPTELRALAAGVAVLVLPGVVLERVLLERATATFDVGALARWLN